MFTSYTKESVTRESRASCHFLAGYLPVLLLTVVSTYSSAESVIATEHANIQQWLSDDNIQTLSTDKYSEKLWNFNTHKHTLLLPQEHAKIVENVQSINDNDFYIHYKKIARANRERLLRQLNKAVELNFINIKTSTYRHLLTINTVSQELTSDQRFGRTRINIKMTKDTTHIKLKYVFR